MDAESFGRREADRMGAPEARRARFAAVLAFAQRVNEQVEARLAGGEAAAVAYPEALRHELERLRHAVEHPP